MTGCQRLTLVGVVAISSIAVACGPSARRGGLERDAGTTRLDGSDGVDSGPEIMLDAGRDSGGGGFDAGHDSGGGGFDAGRDSGGGGFDAGTDSGFGSCDVGAPCTTSVGCRISPFCIGENTDTIGTSGTDEIVGHPSGDATISITSWDEGYCSTVNTLSGGGCDPADDTSCGTCATCLSAGTDPTTGDTITLCARDCTPALASNPCRTGYACSIGNDVCVPGCDSDDECAVYREDTNDDGTIDDGPAEGGVDRLVYDTDGDWTCNAVTYRCEHDGATGAEAGDACVKDTDCEANGACLDEAGTEGDWPSGYCFKLGCDVPGNSCAGGGVCDDRAFGIPVCLAPCTVADTVTASDDFSASADCRTGYSCYWDGSTATTDNGVCIPGNYNSVRTPNIGAPCTDETTCYSPFGLGQCRDFTGDGSADQTCSLFDCDAPGMPSDVCGTGAVCSGVTGSDTTLCLETCTSATDCASGYGCLPGDMVGFTTTDDVCFPACATDTHCRSTETCSSTGRCI